MRYVIFLLALAQIAGCKATPDPGEFTTIPHERLWGFIKKSDAHLVVLGASSLGAGCAIRTSVDGKPAAEFFAGEVAHFGLTFGSHIFSARTTQGCSVEWMRVIRLNVKAGDAMIIRMSNAGLIPSELYKL